MERLDKAKRVVDRALAIVCVALFMILVVVVTWQVFARQILNDPSQWSETLSRYLFVWVGLFGAALVFGERGHIAIDVGVRQLPAKIQKWVAVLVQAIVIAFAGYIMVWGGSRATMNAWNQNLSGLPTAIGPWFLVLPISGVLIVIYSLHALLKIVQGTLSPFSGDDMEATDALETYAADTLPDEDRPDTPGAPPPDDPTLRTEKEGE